MKESTYPLTPGPVTHVDVIIPYCKSDRHLVREAIQSIDNQRHVYPIIHAVADNCDPIYHDSIHHNYQTTKQLGPYWIVNSLVSELTSDYIAIQDADDLSNPNRLWKQVATLNMGYCMTSCAMNQIAIEGYNGTRHIIDPIIYSGQHLTAAPWGKNVNSTRTMLKSFFIHMNGFGDYPMSGDFQFDARCCSLYPDKCHYSDESFAIRRLRPESLSNHPDTGFNTEIRNKISWQVMDTVSSMRRNTTLENAKSLGHLDKVMLQPELIREL